MARIFSTGWESGHLGNFEPLGTYSSRVTIATSSQILNTYPYVTPIEHGNYGLRITAGGYGNLNTSSIVGGGMREFGLRFRFQTTVPHTHNVMLIGRDHETLSSGIIFYVRLSGAGGYTMGIDGGPMEYVVQPLEACRWYLIDMYFKLSTTNSTYDGALDVKINGKSQFGGVLENIIMNGQSSSKLLRNLQIYGPTYNSDTKCFSVYDDFIIANYDDSTSVIEYTDAYAIRGAPSGVGSFHNWDAEPPSQETYECVADVGSSIDNDYIIAKGVGGEESFPITMDDAGITNVESVSLHSRGRKVGDASAYKLRSVVRNNSGSYDGESKDLTTSFDNHYKLWTQNPIEGRDWTVSDLSTLKIGVKSDE